MPRISMLLGRPLTGAQSRWENGGKWVVPVSRDRDTAKFLEAFFSRRHPLRTAFGL